MEKEMKKMLLVAVSVGVFLLVTITVAILLLTPKTGTEETAFSSSYPYPAGRTQPVIENAGSIQPQHDFIQDSNTNNIRDNTIVNITGDRNNGDSLTINIPKPSTAAVPNTAGTSPAASVSVSPNTAASSATSAAARPAATAAVTPTTVTPTAGNPAAGITTAIIPAAVTTTQTVPAARPAAVSGSASTTAVKQTITSRSINDYWVQTGAFSAMIRAEDVKELLASKGITSIIENRIVDGRIWYRVRLGPYTSENEANYWLALVKSIDGFSDSQIRQTVRQQ